MLKRSFVIGTLSLILGGCGELFGTVVDQPRDAVAGMIYNMPVSANVMGLAELVPGTKSRVGQTDAGIVWTFSVYGKDECRFTVHVKSESDSSSIVWSDIDELGNGDRAFLCDAVRITGEESVAATLEGRAADEAKVQHQLAAAVPANMASIQKTIGEEIVRQVNARPDDCYKETTSAAQAACNGNNSLQEPKSDRDR